MSGGGRKPEEVLAEAPENFPGKAQADRPGSVGPHGLMAVDIE